MFLKRSKPSKLREHPGSVNGAYNGMARKRGSLVGTVQQSRISPGAPYTSYTHDLYSSPKRENKISVKVYDACITIEMIA
jgi:hypothetical protein